MRFIIVLGWVFSWVLSSVSLAADFERGDPVTEGIQTENLKALVARSDESESDSLLIVKNGKLILEKYSAEGGSPIQSFSVTKSIVNLGIGFAVAEGKLDSIDAPVHRYFPEWNQGRKKRITIRHLMNHTSGISTASEVDFVYPDLIQYALAAEIDHDPGSRFVYNNKAVQLLSGVLQKITNERTDLYLKKKLFTPLGIVNYRWRVDQANHAAGSAGLEIAAMDLGKIGQMLLDRGLWKGVRVVQEDWIALSTRPSQSYEPRCGLLWWLIDWTPKRGFNAGGWLGQYLAIIPETRTVGVRQLKYKPGMDESNTDEFDDFTERLAGLSEPAAP
ncbi:MAG TPA: serine hydrolase [Bdellovibrionota bacterium]|nr:serine hydrolase [Bdellovibrionota bacterium]